MNCENVCPKCKEIDQVRRVQSIVVEGTKRIYSKRVVPIVDSDAVYSGSYNNIVSYRPYTTLQQVSNQESHYTELAKLLSFPDKPLRDYFGKQFSKPIYPTRDQTGENTLGLAIAISVLITLFFVYETRSLSQGITTGIISSIIPFFLLIKLGKFFEFMNVTGRKYKEELQNYQNELKLWEKNVNNKLHDPYKRWQETYYCSRCGLIFLPSQAVGHEPSEMVRFLLRDLR
jgi:hypothetical protein